MRKLYQCITKNVANKLDDSVAQLVERVPAAPAVPPNNTSYLKTNLFPRAGYKNRFLNLNCLGDTCILHTKRNVAGYNSHGCRLATGLSQRNLTCPRGLMDKASVSEAEDCGFESRRGYLLSVRG